MGGSMSDYTIEEMIKALNVPDTPQVRKTLERSRLSLSINSLPFTPENLSEHLPETLQELAPHGEKGAGPGAVLPDDDPDEEVFTQKPPIPWTSEFADLCRAPYRFVPLNDRIATFDTPDLDRPLEDGLSAELIVQLKVETPLLIGAGEENDTPFQLSPGRWAIPGASLRGMLRSELEILTFSRLAQFNRRHRFALRDFDHERYFNFAQRAERRGTDGLKAGWLVSTSTDGDYAIVPCRDWGRVPIDSIVGRTENWASRGRHAKYVTAGAGDWKSSDLRHPQFFRQTTGDRGSKEYRLVRSQTGQGDKGGLLEGFIVVGGPLPGGGGQRRYEYAFFDDNPRPEPVPIGKEAWALFEAVNPLPSRRDVTEPANAWDELKWLVDEGASIPVFFSGDLCEQGADFSFGLTKLFRLPHARSEDDLLPDAIKLRREPDGSYKADFVDALFGHVHEEADFASPAAEGQPAAALKGRIAIGFAEPSEGSSFALWPEGPVQTIQGTPKPSFAPFYLVGRHKDWSDPDARLAGRKRFLPRRGQESEEEACEGLHQLLKKQSDAYREATGSDPPEAVGSRLRFLRPKSGKGCFEAKMRLHNVRDYELGALLWALTFGGNVGCRHMLGRGKPFGAGQIAVVAITGNLHWNRSTEAASTLSWRSETPCTETSKALKAFEGVMDSACDGAWRESAVLQDYLRFSQPVGWGSVNYHYLPFGAKGEEFKKLRRAVGPRADLTTPYRLLK